MNILPIMKKPPTSQNTSETNPNRPISAPNKSARLNTEAKKIFATLRKENPEAMEGFLDFVHGIDKNGALSPKMKQIISIALSIAYKCEWCMVYHTFKALDLGATEQEIKEACFVATFFGGGPSMMFTKIVWDAIEDYKKLKKNKNGTK